MIRSLLERLFDRSRYRMVSGYEYRVCGLASCCAAALVLHRYETLFNWLLATGIVLYGLGFVRKRQCEGNGSLRTVPAKSLFAFSWLLLFVGIVFALSVLL